MKTILRALLCSGAVGLAGAPAMAADIIDLPPLYENAPEVLQPVEIGNGWYLRGDATYGLETEIEASHREYRPDFELYGTTGPFSEAQYDYFDGGDSDWTLKGGAGFSLGAGYQFTDFLRADVTAARWKHDFSMGERPVASCYETVAGLGLDTDLLECEVGGRGDLRAWELMANVYADLGTIAGFTPYIGGGIGAVRLDHLEVRTSSTCTYAGEICDPSYYHYDAEHEPAKDWRFAYALSAGAAYNLTTNLKLDVGYRYLKVAGGDAYGFDGTNETLGADGAEATDDGFDRHTIQAGLRYSLW